MFKEHAQPKGPAQKSVQVLALKSSSVTVALWLSCVSRLQRALYYVRTKVQVLLLVQNRLGRSLIILKLLCYNN
jgi:hypothetical protein